MPKNQDCILFNKAGQYQRNNWHVSGTKYCLHECKFGSKFLNCQMLQISANFISVPRSCYQIGRQFSISDDNRLDKTYSVQKTAEECNWECYHQDDCKYWTWNEVTHQCWLKKSQGVLSIRAGSTSASKVCPGG